MSGKLRLVHCGGERACPSLLDGHFLKRLSLLQRKISLGKSKEAVEKGSLGILKRRKVRG
jgi:hypothetical protein